MSQGNKPAIRVGSWLTFSPPYKETGILAWINCKKLDKSKKNLSLTGFFWIYISHSILIDGSPDHMNTDLARESSFMDHSFSFNSKNFLRQLVKYIGAGSLQTPAKTLFPSLQLVYTIPGANVKEILV